MYFNNVYKMHGMNVKIVIVIIYIIIMCISCTVRMWKLLLYNIHIRTVHFDVIKVFNLPTEAQESCFKKYIKIYTKTAPTCFCSVTPSSGSASLMLAKVKVNCWWIKNLNYILLVLCLCILIVTYAVFCTFCFHCANWHSLATLTEVFPCFFLSCKANARV